MNCLPKNAASRRYTFRFIPLMVMYCVAILQATSMFKHNHPHGAVAYLLAVLPAFPLIGTIVVVGMYLAEEKDEFQRHLLVQSMLWGIGVTLAVTTVWGFLENFMPVQQFPLYGVFPLFWFFVGVSTAVLKLRYR